jgi:hypothetical protein
MLPGPSAVQGFEPIAGRDAQRLQPCSCVDLQQLPQRDALNFGWKLARPLAIENPFRFAIAKAPNHASHDNAERDVTQSARTPPLAQPGAVAIRRGSLLLR